MLFKYLMIYCVISGRNADTCAVQVLYSFILGRAMVYFSWGDRGVSSDSPHVVCMKNVFLDESSVILK